MKKFYRELPSCVVDILCISKGWLIGGSISDILNKKTPADFDIIIPTQDGYRSAFRYISHRNPDFNSHGGVKVKIGGISIDLWMQKFDDFLDMSPVFTYAYNFHKNILIKKED